MGVNNRIIRNDKLFRNRIFISPVCYKGLVFNAFNIRKIESKVKAKYSTKNNNSEAVDVFLATKNHIRARVISRSIFMLTATSPCKTLLSGFLFWPL
jgi:hypothetical protein